MMNTVLMVGGDLCQRVATRLDPARWSCIGLRRRAMPADPAGRIQWLQADLGDPASLAVLGAAGLPVITHLLVAPTPDARTPEAYARAYPQGLRALLDALPEPDRLQRALLVGSTAVWGPQADPEDAWVDEDTPTAPEDFRGEQLLAAERILQNRLPGRSVVLRLSGLYGPGRLRLIDGLRAGRIPAPAGPGHWANRIHIEDAARACAHLLALAHPLPCYIGTDDGPMPTAELYAALARLAGGPAPALVPSPPDGKRLANTRLRASGWTPDWPRALDGYAAALGAAPPLELSTTLSLRSGAQSWGTERRMALLAAIGTEGSISAAARKVGLSYKAAWDAVDMMNNLSGELLVERVTGGKRGGGAHLTGRARELVAWYQAAQAEHQRFMDRLARFGPDSTRHLDLLHGMALQTSARNRFEGVIGAIESGRINDRIRLDLGEDACLIATLTHASTERLGLIEGRRALAFLKAQAVRIRPAGAGAMHAPGAPAADPEGTNRWTGRIVHLENDGALTEIGLDVGPGVRITGLADPDNAGGALTLGDRAVACFQAADVLIGTAD